jgi:hypothetical protein
MYMRLCAICLLLASSAAAQELDRKLTPGVTVAATTKTICRTKWGKDERHVSTSMKKKVCLAYGIRSGCPGKKYEIDHLVSRELGGADDVNNLWPQPIAEARKKDRVENFLHRQVCSGAMTLDEAQTDVRDGWQGIFRSLK